jgi:L-lactate dehydrogenase (cytochrome)
VSDFWQWVGAGFDPSITWKDIEWVRSRWPGPLIIKGVLDQADAREAVAAGAEGLIVSNHGGRQLDSTPSTISALPWIVDAVGDRTTVMVDGGVRSGLDVVKALALGAKACFVGRPWAWALAARGEAGVADMIQMLRAEMMVALALTGCTDVRRAGPEMLVERP